MDIVKIFEKFPTQKSCIEHLEKTVWSAGPIFPYCFSTTKITKQKNENRFHCNACKTGFSATVNTIFHDTKLPLQKRRSASEKCCSSILLIAASSVARVTQMSYAGYSTRTALSFSYAD